MNAGGDAAAALAAATLTLSLTGALACGSGGGTGLETARQDTFGFVLSADRQQAATSLHVEWSKGPLEVGRSEPFDRHAVGGPRGNFTDFWDGRLEPGDTAAAVIGFEGDPPRAVIVCFGNANGPMGRCP